jgi:succinate dehydrogenase / fumarate reductase cytochrome b subunit
MGRRENKLGILGWLKLKGYSIEKLMYVAQRISGVGIIIFLLAHILNVGLVYAPTKELWEPPGIIGKAVLVILGIIVVFHTFNGVRLILAEYGFIVGKPRRAVYPYRMTSLSGRQRLAVYLVLAVFIIIFYFWIMVAFNLLGW